MFEILWNFSPGQLIGLVAVSGGLVVAAIAIIASHWCRVRLGEIRGQPQATDAGKRDVGRRDRAGHQGNDERKHFPNRHCGHGHGRFGESHANSTDG